MISGDGYVYIFRELHENLGHIGSEKVMDLARRRFYWPNMQKDVEFYVRNKCRCIMSKRPPLHHWSR